MNAQTVATKPRHCIVLRNTNTLREVPAIEFDTENVSLVTALVRAGVAAVQFHGWKVDEIAVAEAITWSPDTGERVAPLQ